MQRLLPPYVNLILLTSSFRGRTSHTILEYTMSYHLLASTSLLLMKNIVLEPVFLPGVPCANHPIVFPNEKPQSFCTLGFLPCGNTLLALMFCHRGVLLWSLQGIAKGTVSWQPVLRPDNFEISPLQKLPAIAIVCSEMAVCGLGWWWVNVHY